MNLIGKKGVYTLSKELGRGKYGITYLAYGQYGDEYAVKKFIGEGKHEHYELEEKILKWTTSFCNQYAACFVEAITENDKYYIVTTYLKGKNVAELIFGKNKMSLFDRRRNGKSFIESLVLGLNEIHRFNIIHQDIKGDNLMYINSDTVKYIDFGQSCLGGESVEFEKYNIFGVGINHPCGTLGSLITTPPEMIGDLGIYTGLHLKAHDYWSLGCVILSWYIVEDDDNKQENHAYYQEFNNVEKYSVIFNELKESEPFAYSVIIGLLNRNPYNRKENFDIIASGHGGFANLFNPVEIYDFVPNWADQSVTIDAKLELCKLRKNLKNEGLRLPEIFLGAKKCDKYIDISVN